MRKRELPFGWTWLDLIWRWTSAAGSVHYFSPSTPYASDRYLHMHRDKTNPIEVLLWGYIVLFVRSKTYAEVPYSSLQIAKYIPTQYTTSA
ncbi:hypothetical protein F5Y12DRAFT_741400 [Xylaria sp. FL1777]|nr:hypothetical protein F5Y12DRAFT_741400 [Xylaria sp. FL1777]